jgi:hypothetical protein
MIRIRRLYICDRILAKGFLEDAHRGNYDNPLFINMNVTWVRYSIKTFPVFFVLVEVSPEMYHLYS